MEGYNTKDITGLLVCKAKRRKSWPSLRPESHTRCDVHIAHITLILTRLYRLTPCSGILPDEKIDRI